MDNSVDRIKEGFAKRINEAMELKGYPVRGRARVLSKEFEVSDKGAGKWLKGESIPETSKLPLIASFLGVTTEWLMNGKGSNAQFDNNIDLSKKIELSGRPIPVISWVAAGSFSPIETILRDVEINETLPPNKDCGKNGYGLIVTGNSMLPKFEPEDRLYVNPDFQVSDLKTNDLVIVSCAGDSEATFKKIIIEGENKFLEPLNPNWPEKIIKMSDDCRLVGKVVGQYRKW